VATYDTRANENKEFILDSLPSLKLYTKKNKKKMFGYSILDDSAFSKDVNGVLEYL